MLIHAIIRNEHYFFYFPLKFVLSFKSQGAETFKLPYNLLSKTWFTSVFVIIRETDIVVRILGDKLCHFHNYQYMYFWPGKQLFARRTMENHLEKQYWPRKNFCAGNYVGRCSGWWEAMWRNINIVERTPMV